jgi:hypothetical protein
MWTPDDLDELTYDREDDGVLVRKHLERVVLARGRWATVLFLFAELDPEAGGYGAPKAAVVRFQKWRGGWRKHAAFNLASEAQARELADVLARWAPSMRGQADDDDDDDAAGADARERVAEA